MNTAMCVGFICLAVYLCVHKICNTVWEVNMVDATNSDLDEQNHAEIKRLQEQVNTICAELTELKSKICIEQESK